MPNNLPVSHPPAPPEPRWPALLGGLAAGALFFTLPESLTLGPRWLLPGIVLVFLCAADISHRIGALNAATILGYAVSGGNTFALAWSLTSLVADLPQHHEATLLLRSAGALWLSNILVFASWYWRL